MRIALVTTPLGIRSGIGDYTRQLLPYLRERAEVDLFVDLGLEEEEGGERTRAVDRLVPRDYDQILYQLGNETQHAFMVPLILGLGGTVMLHDWVLFDLAMAAFPRLARGGLRGLRRAWSEGGLGEARTYLRNKRRGAGEAATGDRASPSGWHAAESSGRWSSASATIAPARGDRLRLELHLPAGRGLRLSQGGRTIEERAPVERDEEVELVLELEPGEGEPFRLDVSGVRPTPEQRRNGDPRELGVYLRRAECSAGGAWRPVDLDVGGAVAPRGLSRDRFRLTLNRAVVRRGDAFLVHSDWMGEQILASRNAPTPIARVHHGVERRWSDRDRRDARRELVPDWRDRFVVASLGALQAHKRPEALLQAVARAHRLREGLRLLLIGEERPTEFDLRARLAGLGLGHVVKATGWLPPERVFEALHAADLCVNLRGPSTGGISGGACQALSLGRGVIVSDRPEVAHLPADCFLRVAIGETEVDDLARLLVELHDDESRRHELERAARRAVEEELHWSHVARRYVEVMEAFPHARAARRSLLVRFVHATRRNR